MAEPTSAPSKRPKTKQRGSRQRAARLNHPQIQPEPNQHLSSDVENICIQINNIWDDIKVLQAAVESTDRMLNDLHNAKVKPNDSLVQNLEDLQSSFYQPAENADSSLRLLIKRTEDLALLAQSSKPELHHDILILRAAATEYHRYVNRFVIDLYGREGRVENNVQVRAAKRNRREQLKDIPSPQQRSRSAEQEDFAMVIERLHPDPGLGIGSEHPFSQPIKDLYEEDTAIKIEENQISQIIMSTYWAEMEALIGSQSTQIRETYVKDLKYDLLLATALLERMDAFQSYMAKLRDVYEAGPRCRNLDRLLDDYERGLSLLKVKVDLLIYEFSPLVDERAPKICKCEGQHESFLADLREATILGTHKIAFHCDPDLFESLKEADTDCEATNDEDHHYWYKGLHPLSNELHTAAHRLKDIAHDNDALQKKPRKRFLRATKRQDPEALKKQADKIANFEHRDFLELRQRYQSETPELQFHELNLEIQSMNFAIDDERMRNEELRRNGPAGNSASLDQRVRW